jgi:hypothetical protein
MTKHVAHYEKFGLTEAQWHAILAACGHRCPACHKPFSLARPAVVDHEHLTGMVRGAMCQHCNWAVGERHDSQMWFASVAAYLLNPPALAVVGTIYKPGSPGAAGELESV